MTRRENFLMKLQKLYVILIVVLEFSLALSMGNSLFNENYLIFFISFLIFVLVPLPYLFKWRYRIRIPLEIEIIAVLFIYMTIFLGEAQGFYDLFWWWDILLHGFSAIVFGFIGFVVLYFLYSHHKIESRLFWVGVFTFSFALSIGALWEIFEFSMDQLLGLNMQKSGLIDTMVDLIVDAAGALIVSLLGYFYLKNKKTFFLRRFFGYVIGKN